jgi:hypothetical protein
VGEEGEGGVIEEGLGEEFGGGVLGREADDAVAVAGFEVVVGWVVGIHAEGMVERVEEVADGFLDDFEVTDHLILVEFVGFEDEFDFTGVAVGELAFVWVLGEHVPVFDVDGFADAEGHGWGIGRVELGKDRERYPLGGMASIFGDRMILNPSYLPGFGGMGGRLA